MIANERVKKNYCRSQWPRGLRHELSSPAPIRDRGFESHLGMDVCVCSVCVFSVST
jgi:hypothetical protein